MRPLERWPKFATLFRLNIRMACNSKWEKGGMYITDVDLVVEVKMGKRGNLYYRCRFSGGSKNGKRGAIISM